jgi:hypothetical protein
MVDPYAQDDIVVKGTVYPKRAKKIHFKMTARCFGALGFICLILERK